MHLGYKAQTCLGESAVELKKGFATDKIAETRFIGYWTLWRNESLTDRSDVLFNMAQPKNQPFESVCAVYPKRLHRNLNHARGHGDAANFVHASHFHFDQNYHSSMVLRYPDSPLVSGHSSIWNDEPSLSGEAFRCFR